MRSTPYPYDPNSPQSPSQQGGGDTGGYVPQTDPGTGTDATRPYGTYDGTTSGQPGGSSTGGSTSSGGDGSSYGGGSTGSTTSDPQSGGMSGSSGGSYGSSSSQSGASTGGGTTGSSGQVSGGTMRYKDLDTDASGGLSLTEIQSYSTDVTSDQFNQFDRNSDGVLSNREYKRWMRSQNP